MDDPDYAAKYDAPYGDDKICRMAKQIVDARHVGGKSGSYIGGAVQKGHPLSVGGQIGKFYYPTPSISTHAGFMGLGGTGTPDLYFGLDTGLRVQAPTRFSPFAGVGTFVGCNWHTIATVTEFMISDEEEDEYETYEERDNDLMPRFFGAVYPEVGAHFWLNGNVRLTASGSYYLTTAGRDDDFWFCGLYLCWLNQ